MTESDSQALLALSEEISREFAPRLEQTALVLYDRDPEHLQAQWHITPQALAEARGLFPGDGSDLRQTLRLCRLDQDGRAEVVASTPQETGASQGTGQDGFARHGDGAEYACELGLESETGGWLLLARSNRVRPAAWIAPVPDLARVRNAAYGPAAESDGWFEGMPIEPALASVGEPLYPVFPNLMPDASPPGQAASLPEALGTARLRDQGWEFRPSVLQDGSAPYREPATDSALDADLEAMPPPLLPSSPEPDVPATDDMPGPLYDPRAALSSAVLGGVRF